MRQEECPGHDEDGAPDHSPVGRLASPNGENLRKQDGAVPKRKDRARPRDRKRLEKHEKRSRAGDTAKADAQGVPTKREHASPRRISTHRRCVDRQGASEGNGEEGAGLRARREGEFVAEVIAGNAYGAERGPTQPSWRCVLAWTKCGESQASCDQGDADPGRPREGLAQKDDGDGPRHEHGSPTSDRVDGSERPASERESQGNKVGALAHARADGPAKAVCHRKCDLTREGRERSGRDRSYGENGQPRASRVLLALDERIPDGVQHGGHKDEDRGPHCHARPVPRTAGCRPGSDTDELQAEQTSRPKLLSTRTAAQ